ncbi:hypothetical protein Sps_02255 [Shewanella psychrophila]|uniref:Lipoprotein n=1 Tax=Shewanella psychrophila TaxID=225848 RepID=A0A1S6HPG7_9GAMM|nr:hypothetical protein [Shewanella psychrophila]AQS37413.1 hypothetical protein Sps_02255 [Shewanella psychrophila]
MHISIKNFAVAISLFLLSACGGSSSDEAINFSIGLPKADGYSHLIASNLNKTHSNMIQQVWRSGNDHSIQIHSSQVSKSLKLKVSGSDGNKPWELAKDINVAKDTGYLVVTPQEADIEGTPPVVFVKGLDSNSPAGDYYSVINRFSDSTLGSTDSDICLVAVSQDNDAVFPISSSLKQGQATELRDLSMLNRIWRLAVVTRAELNVQEVSILPSVEQLTMIQAICSDFTVGNGETLRLLDPTVYPSSMTANIIYSPAAGEVAFTGTSVGLNSLAWENK